MVQIVRNVVEWLQSWFYTKNEVYAKSETYDKNTIDSALSNKLNSNLTVANKMLVTDNTGNVVLDDLPSFNAIEVVATLPTASASTMGKLYIINENSQVNVYYTETDNGEYAWHEMDTDILDDLSIEWNDVQNKPSTFPPSTHSHTATQINDANAHTNIGTSANTNQAVINTSIDFQLGGKAQTDHSTTYTTFGVGTTGKYGHNKVIDDLTHSSFAKGESLSAHQGYVLQQAINGKQSIGDCVTSIELVPKSQDSTGAIKLYYGDES